jgi:hypothetical protein
MGGVEAESRGLYPGRSPDGRRTRRRHLLRQTGGRHATRYIRIRSAGHARGRPRCLRGIGQRPSDRITGRCRSRRSPQPPPRTTGHPCAGATRQTRRCLRRRGTTVGSEAVRGPDQQEARIVRRVPAGVVSGARGRAAQGLGGWAHSRRGRPASVLRQASCPLSPPSCRHQHRWIRSVQPGLGPNRPAMSSRSVEAPKRGPAWSDRAPEAAP